ncbi:hypothetical protein QFC19_007336 [Naganishia cerealis]|uniref:Uncharacterized protein n=1 Tax=Naganishia cerealis TaxID=610337 RepID=A0ACC2VAI5_9TREE|nr:hypothetical protein QFC19_007336 [Naganishia cerealis]
MPPGSTYISSLEDADTPRRNAACPENGSDIQPVPPISRTGMVMVTNSSPPYHNEEWENLMREKTQLAALLEASLLERAQVEAKRRKADAARLFMDVAEACRIELERLQQEKKNRKCRDQCFREALKMAMNVVSASEGGNHGRET